MAKGFDNIYGNEGKRYAFEQTVCFTVPRTMQQLYRNKHITGEVNKMAAWEMLIRDLMADFLDTFAPGLLAFGVIAPWLDKRHGAMTRRMMGQDGLNYYAAMAKPVTDSHQFLTAIDAQLQAYVGRNNGKALADKALKIPAMVQAIAAKQAQHEQKMAKVPYWRRMIARMTTTNPAETMADGLTQRWVAATGMTTHDVSLALPKAAKTATHALNVSLPEMLLDLGTIVNHQAKKPKKALTSGYWGQKTTQLLGKTKKLARHHMWANAFALAASLSMPFVIRLITKSVYGKDAYPGSKALQDHFKSEAPAVKATERHHAFVGQPSNPSPGTLQAGFAANDATSTKNDEPASKGFTWFPHLKKEWKEGRPLHSAITAGFFAVLGAAVLRNRFLGAPAVRKFGKKLNPTKWKDLVKVYQFQRGFPWTTIAQMELTYGLLCGIRLLSARNDSEWQETALRDAMLGWPTLTYGFEFVRKQLAKAANAPLVKAINAKTGATLTTATALLRDAGGDVRPQDHLTQGMVRNITGLSGQGLKKAVDMAVGTRRGLTVVSSVISILLLSWLEPKWGIQLTTNLERKKHRKALASSASPILTRTQAPLPGWPAPSGSTTPAEKQQRLQQAQHQRFMAAAVGA